MSIRVDTIYRTVLNTLSAGPGCEPTTYELSGGEYVYRVGSTWYLQRPGQFKQSVTVTTEGE